MEGLNASRAIISRFETKAKQKRLSILTCLSVRLSRSTVQLYLSNSSFSFLRDTHSNNLFVNMSSNDKSEVAVEKVPETEKIDPKAEVKGTKRPAEEKTDEVKKAKKEENGEDEEVEDEEEVEAEDEEDEGEEDLQGEEEEEEEDEDAGDGEENDEDD